MRERVVAQLTNFRYSDYVCLGGRAYSSLSSEVAYFSNRRCRIQSVGIIFEFDYPLLLGGNGYGLNCVHPKNPAP